MEERSSKSRSISRDFTEEDVHKTHSSFTDPNLSSKKGSSLIKDLNSVRGSVLDKKSFLLQPRERPTSLSSTSELISVKNISTKDSIVRSPQTKSQISGIKTVSVQGDSFVTQKKSSEKSGLHSVCAVQVCRELDPTLVSPKNTGTKSNETNKTPSKQTHSIDNKEIKRPNRIKTNHKEMANDMEETRLNYISPWAKSLSETSCGSKASKTSEKSKEIKDDFNFQCIPPWAKTLRKAYGMTYSDPSEELSHKNLQEKIKSLMEKHSRLMLVKRGESRKQLILKPSECGDFGTVKMRSKNTKYYMTPISRETEDPIFQDDQMLRNSRNDSISENLPQESDEMSVTKKTSRHQAKTEVSSILKSLYNSKRKNLEADKDNNKPKRQLKCPTITPSKIREYVADQTLDPDKRQLHEIIKIKKVPNFGQVGRKGSSKYIINIPKGTTTGDETTVNKITVKEKRKLRMHSIEDINENVTEIIYNKHDSKLQDKVESGYTAEENIQHDVLPYSKKRKSPTKSRTLEVKNETTPIISNLLKEEQKGRDKILLIQYEEKTQPSKGKPEAENPTLISTQLLGIKQACNETLKEMYLYGTETDGKTCKENITQVDDASPTLREKLNMIIQELREKTFKPCAEHELTEEGRPSVSSKTFQHPSILVETDAVSIQALPEVRSVEVQVHDSVLLSPTELGPGDRHPTLSSYLSEEDKKESIGSLGEKVVDIEDEVAVQETRSQLDSTQASANEEEYGERLEEVPDLNDIETSQKSETSMVGLEMKKTSSTEVGIPEVKDETYEESDEKDIKTITKDDFEEEITPEDYEEETLEEDQKEETIPDDHLKEESITEDHGEKPLLGEEQTKKDLKEDRDETKTKKGDEGSKLTIDDLYLEEGKEFKDEKGKDEEYVGETKLEREDSGETDDLLKPWVGNQGFTEDIRSYDFDPAQDYELRMISSSKFFHQRDSLRKLHWSEDILYLEKNTCPQLIKGLAEIAMIQPADPVSYLAHWIYKDYHNCETDEQRSVYKEHLEVAKDLTSTKKDEKLVCKKFGVSRYPIKTHSSAVFGNKASQDFETTGATDLEVED